MFFFLCFPIKKKWLWCLYFIREQETQETKCTFVCGVSDPILTTGPASLKSSVISFLRSTGSQSLMHFRHFVQNIKWVTLWHGTWSASCSPLIPFLFKNFSPKSSIFKVEQVKPLLPPSSTLTLPWTESSDWELDRPLRWDGRFCSPPQTPIIKTYLDFCAARWARLWMQDFYF